MGGLPLGSILGLIGTSLAAAAAHSVAALSVPSGGSGSKIYGDAAIRRYIQRYGRTRARGIGSIAEGNRHTSGPHQHIRERARRLHPPGAARKAWIAAQEAL